MSTLLILLMYEHEAYHTRYDTILSECANNLFGIMDRIYIYCFIWISVFSSKTLLLMNKYQKFFKKLIYTFIFHNFT